jgi:hypothetical protein
MTEKWRYITDEQGQPVGVLLDFEEYQRLRHQAMTDPEMLMGLSFAELQALAESMLAPSAQMRLDELLARHQENLLPEEDITELDHLLEQGDHLNILKTRARYTLGFPRKIIFQS